MSVEKLFQRYAGTDESTEQDPIDDRGSYGVLRGQRDRALMIELRKKDGEVLAIPYAMIEQVHFVPGSGITIHAGGREIQIGGRQLNVEGSGRMGLLNAIARHRLAWVQEQSRAAWAESDSSATVIESLEW